MSDRDVRRELWGVFGVQRVTIGGIVELFTEDKFHKEMAVKILGRALGEEGGEYLTPVFEDGKPRNNRVVTRVKPEKIYSWDLHKLQ